MTKRQRTFLFLAATVLFLLATPAVILYSQGLRIDWKNRTLTHTGGIFLKAVPSRATISLDGSFVKRTDFFFDSALLTNLLPGNYDVVVEKEGYIPWKKTLPVQKAQVTEEKHVILFSQDISFQTLFSNVLNFWPSPDGSLFVFQKKLDSRTWQLTSWNPQDGREIVLWEAPLSNQVEDIIWSPDSNAIALRLAALERERYLLWNLKGQTQDACVLTPCSLDFLGLSSNEVAFSSENSQHVLFTVFQVGSVSLKRANYVTKAIPETLAKDILAFSSEGRNVWWLDEKGILWEKNLASQDVPVSLNKEPYLVRPETKYTISGNGSILLFQETNGELFEVQRQGEITKLSTEVTSFLRSPDKQKVVLVKGNQLAVLFLDKKKELVLETFAKTPKNLVWLNSNYLFATINEKAVIIEIDEFGMPNIVDLGTFKKPKLGWNSQTQSLFLQSETTFLSSEKLLP
ncbi:MAG: hypothetical protein A2842_01965 [Candidatus Wildermuthbacteria bacterium RIFCSPHIGHO2_01_FULL_48_25]|uniref:PEGA domain-containing protein n=1 Tax=Candidatus Wildermuthbacteria bacterium RIFCSPLOWO2_01_FULL_48_16 TaxID=1802461 RepID=A0A1G2RN48_9BACT|nr:MAG: hypothetical protein A2842_01965 [Candidatus Wildermuthbacteria bacterium RIFCSPHIGHO2_01_FULL_48_25]OHA69264.1 MAG: hypothetical protein A3J57_01785 [Candidatus Wildermuthbacteria bacterium RIFCSPHIGHO2_02_FULL_49_12b]OHA73441.1 MAG: hypothetical protein A3B24_02430 [Candidatus Wildermuthbacteria bacterium RIFCSPLOWO2_01_FULL_48_16]